jgi:TadE-like protein
MKFTACRGGPYRPPILGAHQGRPYHRGEGRPDGSEEGQTLVEFALVLLPFLMLVFGIIRFGILFNNYVTLSNAVGVEANTLATNRAAGASSQTNQNACQLAAAALNQFAVALNTSQVTTNLSTSSPNPFPSPDASTCNALVSGDMATVEASYPCDLQILALNVWPSCKLVSETSIRIE